MRASRARRTAVGAVCLLGLVPAAVACTSDSDPARPTPRPSSTSPAPVTHLTFGVYGPRSETSAFRSTVEEWNAFSKGPEVHLRVSPKTRGEGFEFVDEVVGGSIPRQFIPAVEKGIVEQCEKGVLAGYPFVDVAATVHFGKFHDVDSDEFSFKLASRQAFRLAVRNARPALLEPILKVDIEVPARFLGDISGDLNSRRGRIMTMNQEGDLAHIEAQVPLSEMTQYSTELRSITAGEGDYSFVFDHYDVVPPHLAEAIMASAQKDAEED